MASDKSPRTLMAKYCMTLCIATLVNSVLGLFWGHLARSPGTNPQLCPTLLPYHLMLPRPGDLYSWDSIGQNFANCEILLNIKKGDLVSFSLYIFLCAKIGFGVSNTSLFRKSIYFISTEFSHANSTVWILQIQQCAAKSGISTSKDCRESWGERYQTHEAELVAHCSFLGLRTVGLVTEASDVSLCVWEVY